MYLYNITFSVLFVSFSAFAAETDLMSKFPTLQECNAGFALAKDKVAGDTVSSYCSTHVMNDIEICIAPKVKAYVFENKLGSFSNMTNSEQLSLITKKKFECQKDAQKVTMTADQQRRADDQKKAATALVAGGAAVAAGGVVAGGAAPGMQGLQNAQTALALTQQGVKVSEAIEKREQQLRPTGSATATQPAAATIAATDQKAAEIQLSAQDDRRRAEAGERSAPAASTASETAAPSNVASGSSATSSTTDANGMQTNITNYGDGTGYREVVAPSGEIVRSEILPMPPSAIATVTATQAPQQLGSAAQDLAGNASELAAPANALAANANGGGAAAPVTDTTTATQAVNSTLTSSTTSATSGLAAAAVYYTEANIVAKKIQTAMATYVSTKSTCASLVQNAEFLCMEGTSPGSIAAKELMNAAGPILSIISSAQKTCSTTAKLTKLAGTGLLVAKGVCIAAKVACDSSCGSAATQLKAIQAMQPELTAATARDLTRLRATCIAPTDLTGCPGLQIYASVQTAVSTINTTVNNEAPPKPGTSAGLVLKCQSMAKDIALFAVQALGSFAASLNAQKCADQLAGTTGSSTVSKQQYCEKSENASQQLCVCQRTPMATGCPQAVVASTATTKTDEKGNNIQSANGNSAFGGGFKNVAPKSAFGNTRLDSNGNPLPAGAAGSETGSGGASAGNGGGGGSGSGGGSGGGVNAPAGSADEKMVAKEADKKKWSFGSFGGAGGGFFGGGGGSGGAKSSGTLGQKQQEAIKRQLASEQISAEVSSASGKSNWEKVRNMYLIKENSFILGQ